MTHTDASNDTHNWLRSALGGLPSIDQNIRENSGTAIGVALTIIAGAPPGTEIRDELIDFSLRSTALPDDFDTHIQALLDPGSIVVISDEPGSGRRSLATALVSTLKREHGFRACMMSLEEMQTAAATGGKVRSNCAFLLVLADDDEESKIPSRFGEDLSSVELILEAAASRLVVVTSPEQWQRIRAGWPTPAIRVPLIPPMSIITSQLSARWSRSIVQKWISDPRINDLAGMDAGHRSPPRIAMRVAHLISQAIDAPALAFKSHGSRPWSDAEDFEARVLSVISGYGSWHKELLRWHRAKGRTSIERNFLIAAAALKNQPAISVYIAAVQLSKMLGEGTVDLAGQRAPGVYELADSVGARIHEGDVLYFDRPGYEAAVLKYFLTDRPLCRISFTAWAADLPLSVPGIAVQFNTSINSLELLQQASLIILQSLRTSTESGLVSDGTFRTTLADTVSHWAAERQLREGALNMLTAACFDQTIGRRTHEALRIWARSDDTLLRTIVVDVCKGPFGFTYLEKALVRLCHVGSTDDAGLREVTCKAVAEMWRSHAAHLTILQRVLVWRQGPQELRRKLAASTFATLALTQSRIAPGCPALLIDARDGHPVESAPVDQLIMGWSHAIRAIPYSCEVRLALRFWFDACLSQPSIRPIVILILSRASESEDDDDRTNRFVESNLRDEMYQWEEGAEPGRRGEYFDLRFAVGDEITRYRTEWYSTR